MLRCSFLLVAHQLVIMYSLRIIVFQLKWKIKRKRRKERKEKKRLGNRETYFKKNQIQITTSIVYNPILTRPIISIH